MRILSWNIQWGRGADGAVRLDRTLDLIRRLAPLDAICLQEVACNWPGLKGQTRVEDQPRRIAEAFPGYQTVYAAGVEEGDGAGGTRGFGNLLMCRARLGQIFRRLLPAPLDASAPSMQRICIEAAIDCGGFQLRLLTTHLEYYSVRQRRAQVEALREIQAGALEASAQAAGGGESLFRMPPRARAALLCGDLNFAPDSAEYARLCAAEPGAEALWCDAWSRVHGARAHAATVGLHGAEWPERPYCCDYFMASPELAGRLATIEVIADTAASDHQPLLLELDAS